MNQVILTSSSTYPRLIYRIIGKYKRITSSSYTTTTTITTTTIPLLSSFSSSLVSYSTITTPHYQSWSSGGSRPSHVTILRCSFSSSRHLSSASSSSTTISTSTTTTSTVKEEEKKKILLSLIEEGNANKVDQFIAKSSHADHLILSLLLPPLPLPSSSSSHHLLSSSSNVDPRLVFQQLSDILLRKGSEGVLKILPVTFQSNDAIEGFGINRLIRSTFSLSKKIVKLKEEHKIGRIQRILDRLQFTPSAITNTIKHHHGSTSTVDSSNSNNSNSSNSVTQDRDNKHEDNFLSLNMKKSLFSLPSSLHQSKGTTQTTTIPPTSNTSEGDDDQVKIVHMNILAHVLIKWSILLDKAGHSVDQLCHDFLKTICVDFHYDLSTMVLVLNHRLYPSSSSSSSSHPSSSHLMNEMNNRNIIGTVIKSALESIVQDSSMLEASSEFVPTLSQSSLQDCLMHSEVVVSYIEAMLKVEEAKLAMKGISNEERDDDNDYEKKKNSNTTDPLYLAVKPQLTSVYPLIQGRSEEASTLRSSLLQGLANTGYYQIALELVKDLTRDDLNVIIGQPAYHAMLYQAALNLNEDSIRKVIHRIQDEAHRLFLQEKKLSGRRKEVVHDPKGIEMSTLNLWVSGIFDAFVRIRRENLPRDMNNEMKVIKFLTKTLEYNILPEEGRQGLICSTNFVMALCRIAFYNGSSRITDFCIRILLQRGFTPRDDGSSSSRSTSPSVADDLFFLNDEEQFNPNDSFLSSETDAPIVDDNNNNNKSKISGNLSARNIFTYEQAQSVFMCGIVNAMYAKDTDLALKIFYMMMDHKVMPNEKTIARILLALTAAQKYDETIQLFKRLAAYPNAPRSSDHIIFALEAFSAKGLLFDGCRILETIKPRISEMAALSAQRKLPDLFDCKAWKWTCFFPLLENTLIVLAAGEKSDVTVDKGQFKISLQQAIDAAVYLLDVYLIAYPQPLESWPALNKFSCHGAIIKAVKQFLDNASPDVARIFERHISQKNARGAELLKVVKNASFPLKK